jgi:formate dehydrogenase subunit gamma
MEFVRHAANPWGQDILVGISWTLMWVALGASVLFVVGHLIWVRTRASSESPESSVPAADGIPGRILRHSMASRLFHWLMAAAMLVLLVTAFVPVIGYQFPWVTVHWIAGLVLLAVVAVHIVRAVAWQDFWSMMSMGAADVREGMAQLRHLLSAGAPPPERAGKYPFDHRLYHHAVVIVAGAAIVTGLFMMVRIDTPFWTRNPYLLSDGAWGVVYVLHGLAGVSLILLTVSHIYFAIRPEKRWLTWSMIWGWIDREHYLAHHDPEKWVVTGDAPTEQES